MQKKRNYIFLFFIVCFIVFISFYRDYFFRCINAMLLAWDYETDYPMPAHLDFFEQLEYDTVVNLKWVFTIFFSFVFYLISHFTIKHLFENKQYTKITGYAFLGLISVSAFFMGIGVISSSLSERMYEFARFIMGIAQSPLVLMILIPAFILTEKEKQKN